MKTHVFLLCAVLIFCTFKPSQAQDTLKTSANHWTAELNINPLQGQVSLNNALNQVKVRYFKTNQLAYRLALSLNNTKKDDGAKNAYGSNPIDNSDIKKTTSFGLNLGFEKHTSGTHRLSPYIGGEIAFGLKYTSETMDTKSYTTQIDGAWETMVYSYNGNTIIYSTSIMERGYVSVGLNVIAGFDYYIAKHFFFGYEMMFGFTYTKYDDIVTTITSKTSQTIDNSTPDQTSTERSFGPKIINGIRLGYTF